MPLCVCHKGYTAAGAGLCPQELTGAAPPPRFVLQRKGSADFIVELQRRNSSSSPKRKRSLQCAGGLQFRPGLPEQLRKEQISAGTWQTKFITDITVYMWVCNAAASLRLY